MYKYHLTIAEYADFWWVIKNLCHLHSSSPNQMADFSNSTLHAVGDKFYIIKIPYHIFDGSLNMIMHILDSF